MISENEYLGRIPYEEYVRRYNLNIDALPKSSKKKPVDKQEDKPVDTTPTKEEIKKYIEDNKINLNDKTKEYIKKTIESKTGTSFDDINKAIDDLQDELDDTDKGKEKRKQLLKGLQLTRALKPNTEDLLPIERIRAKFAQAGKIAYMNDDNYAKAQAFIDGDPDIPNGYTIDKDLSTKSGLVIRTPDGKTELSYRGSQILDKTSFDDIKSNFKVISGFESEDPQFIRAKQQYEGAVNKYGSVEHISGYSLGGGKSLYLGQKYDVPSTAFNPVIGNKTARGITNTTKEHTIIRSTNDPTSLPLAVSTNANHENWNVKALKPLKKNTSLIPAKEMYDGHKLDNFTIPRNTGNVSTSPHALEHLPIKIASLGNQLGQYQELNRIDDYIKNNKSYSDYYFDLQKGNKDNFTGDGDVGLVNGKPLIKRQSADSTRHIEDKGMAKMWKTMGGEFTDEEQSVFNSAKLTEPKVDKMISDTEDFENQIKELQKELGMTDEELTTEAGKITDDMLEEPITDEEAGLIRGENRKPTPAEKELRDNQEEEFGKIESKQTASVDDFEEIPRLTGLNEEQLNNYSNANANERQNIVSDHLEDMTNSIHELGSNTAPMEVAGFREHLGESISGTSLAKGMLIGLGVDSALNLIDAPGDKQKLTGVSREVVSGGLSGAIGSAMTTGLGGIEATSIAPEILAGSAGYVAGSEGGKLIGEGIKKLGGGEDAQSAGRDIGGGFLGGLTAGATAIGSATLLGSELGSVGGVAGIALGASIGLVGGTLGFAGEEIYNHRKDIGKFFSNTGKKIGGFFKSIF
jgi:23S rRNA maturation mini-RNase III